MILFLFKESLKINVGTQIKSQKTAPHIHHHWQNFGNLHQPVSVDTIPVPITDDAKVIKSTLAFLLRSHIFSKNLW